jgi:hypothetical protein
LELNINISNIKISIIISHMSQVAAANTKKIAKTGPGRQVRLWVRAKFLSFRRYLPLYADRRLPKTPTRPF